MKPLSPWKLLFPREHKAEKAAALVAVATTPPSLEREVSYAGFVPLWRFVDSANVKASQILNLVNSSSWEN